METPATMITFPLEIERIIFLSALHSDPDEFINYILVAKYVREWVMNAAFEIVMLSTERTYPKGIKLDQLKRYGHQVRHLLASDSFKDFPIDQTIIDLCPNVENLALWKKSCNHETLQALTKLPLKRFSIDIAYISKLDTLTPQHFANITHLDLAPGLMRWTQDEVSVVTHFRVLTHLAVCVTTSVGLVDILKRLPGLKVLVCLGHSRPGPSRWDTAISRSIEKDIRAVRVECWFVGDWESGARGGQDMWSLAEELVQKRQEQSLEFVERQD